MIATLKQAVRMLEDEDMTHWSDAHATAVLEVLYAVIEMQTSKDAVVVNLMRLANMSKHDAKAMVEVAE